MVSDEGQADAGPTRRRRRLGVLASLPLGIAALVGSVLTCARPHRAPPQRWKAERLLGIPRDDFDEAGLYQDAELRRVPFRSRADSAGWSMGDGGPLPEPSKQGLRLTGERATKRVIGPLGEEAALVDVVEVELAQESPSGVALFWPRADGRFFADQAMAKLPDARGVVRFEVASHPRWRGRVARIAIQPSFGAQSVLLRSVRFLGLRMDTPRALAVTPEVRTATLDGDSRPALAVTRERAASVSARVPPRAQLRFALGLPQHVSASAGFKLSLAAEGREEVRRLRYRIERGHQATGWSEHEVDLDAYAGLKVTFALSIDDDPSDTAPVAFWANPMLRVPADGEHRPSVLLVSADTLRADHLSLYGYRRATSPSLERWARRRGAVFLNSVAPSPWTLPSHVSLFTGVDAHRHGVSRQGPIPSELPVLAELFRDAGYVTLASTGGGLVDAKFGFGRGFDVFRSREKVAGHESRSELELGIEETLGWIERHAGEPLFLFFHTYATHTPLLPREPFFSRLRGPGPLPDRPLDVEPVSPEESEGFRRRYRFVWTKPLPDGTAQADGGPKPDRPAGLDLSDPQLGLDLYDSAIAELDARLGRVFDRLEALGLADQTIVVFTSDHGESFGENGLFAHTHLQDSNLMVPLVVAPRPAGGRRRHELQVRVVDVAPTVLEMAGITRPPGLSGRSLVPLLKGVTHAHPEQAWSYASNTNWGLGLRLANRWKLIVPNTIWPGLRGRDELYDLAADRAETRNVAGGRAYAPLRALAARELSSIRKGVVVALSCGRAPCYEVVIRGLGGDRTAVTSADLTCACIEPVPAGTRLSPGAGDTLTIVYEDVVHGEMALDLQSRGEASAKRSLTRRVGPGQAPFALRLEAGGWRLDEPASKLPANGILVSYEGSIPQPRPDVSREMEERLRALGYIQ